MSSGASFSSCYFLFPAGKAAVPSVLLPSDPFCRIMVIDGLPSVSGDFVWSYFHADLPVSSRFFALLSKSEAVFYNVVRIPCYIRQVYPGQRDSESVFRLQPFFFLALFLLIV